MIETMTFNASNWTGEDIAVRVDRENLTWEQNGTKFWLEPNSAGWTIRGESWDADYSLGTVYHWEEGVFEATSMGIERMGDDPIVTAAKLLANTV